MIFRVLDLALVGALLVPIEGAEVHIETVCMPRAELLSTLAKRYREFPVEKGLSYAGHVVEIAAGPHGRWTIFRTDAFGFSCVIDTGEFWNFRKQGERS